MSIPLRSCLYSKALEDAESFNLLVDIAMQPIYSTRPCRCDPPCRELTEDEKKLLQDRVNVRIREMREQWRKEHYEKEATDRPDMTLEDICGFAATYLTEKTKEPFTAQDVYNLNPARNLAYYLELYEEAVFATGKDFYGRDATEYFDERFLTVRDDPTAKVLAIRYQNAIHKLEQRVKGIQ